MKLFGYENSSESAPGGPTPLAEATLMATPAELRQIAAFLTDAASRMEQMGATFDHEHLADKKPGFTNSPSFVVAVSEV